MVPDKGVRYAVGGDIASVLPQQAKPWYRTAHLLQLNLLLFSCMLFSSTTGYDNSLMNGLQALTPWKTFMHHPKGTYLGIINAAQAIGGLVGFPAMSIVAQRFGRKKAIYCGCLLITLGTCLQTGASTRPMFIISRVFVGASSGFFGSVPLLVGETAYSTHRGVITSIYQPLYYVGSVLSAWVTYGTRDLTNNAGWRIPSALQVAIPLLILLPTIMAPESPRWLVAKDRIEEARSILVKYHAGGVEHSPLVSFELAEIEETLRREHEHAAKAGYLDMFKTKGNRHRFFVSLTLGVFAQWNGVGIISYYLTSVLKTIGIASVTQQTLINGFLQTWNLLTALTAAGLVDRLGRRLLFLTSSVGMLACYVVMTALSGSYAEHHNKGVGVGVVPMLYLFYGFYNMAFAPLLGSYPVEIWPYDLRSRGIVITHGSTFLALFFNLFANPIAFSAIAWKYYIVYDVLLILICVTIYFTYPETRGHTLEEIAVVFDGKDAAIPSADVILETFAYTSEEKRQFSHIEEPEQA